ncbi:MAG: hypothetical protein ACJAVK_003710 [Akkermansiaceae bacterium]|jgi:hypothetical protein
MSAQWIVQATVPYIDGTFEENGVETGHISGLSDVSFLGTWRPSSIDGLSFTLGVRAPTGEERDQPVIGVAAPSVFQLGTGTWQGMMGTGYAKQQGEWVFSSQLDVSLPLETSRQGFRPAESYFLTLGARRRITDSFNLGLALQGSYTTKDEFGGLNLANTGATTIAIRPSFVWRINERLNMSGSIDLPVYWDVNAIGIATGPTWRLGLTTSF